VRYNSLVHICIPTWLVILSILSIPGFSISLIMYVTQLLSMRPPACMPDNHYVCCIENAVAGLHFSIGCDNISHVKMQWYIIFYSIQLVRLIV
jgi:hypothetical protein